MWELKETFPGVQIAKIQDQYGYTLLVIAPQALRDVMDGWTFEDHEFTGSPSEPGFYVCDVELWYLEGWAEGYRSDADSEIKFKLINVVNVAVPQEQASNG